MVEPLSPPNARKLIRAILERGEVRFSKHAQAEMKNDRLLVNHCLNVLRGGIVEPGEWENGSWRYRVHAGLVWVVVTFRSEEALVVVTAWRSRR